MKPRLILLTALLGALTATAGAQMGGAGGRAALTTAEPTGLTVGASYTRIERTVKVDDLPADILQADVIELMLGWQPVDWLLLYVQGGGNDATVENLFSESPGYGAGGEVGLKLNLWQIDDGPTSGWRFLVKLEGSYAYRVTDEDDLNGKLEWSEFYFGMPFTYSLHFPRSTGIRTWTDFSGLDFFVGPAVSKLDGTWKRNGQERDFEEDDLFGVIGGAELWFLKNVCFGGRATYFGEVGFSAYARYSF